MERATTREAFMARPLGSWLAVGSAVVWCRDAALCGAVAWGRPADRDIEAMLEVFSGYEKLAPQFDLVLDGRRITGIDPEPLARVIEWLVAHRDLAERVRLQMGVIDDNLAGITLSGILPALGDMHRFQLVRRSEEAFTALLGEDGAALASEVEAAVGLARGETEELRGLRELLQRKESRVELAEAAHELHLSVRTLQRMLQLRGTSFQDEVKRARFELAETLLSGSDDKIASIAARLGISEGGLTRIVRDATGMTPGELRISRRGGD